MLALFYILTILNLLWITYQDFKSKEIYLLSFFTLLISFIGISVIEIPTQIIINNTISNIILLVPFLTFIPLMIVIKNKNIKSISQAIGLGDVIFIGVLVFFLHPSYLIALILLSSILSVVIHFFILRKKDAQIPYAGYFSLCLTSFICVGFLYQEKLFNPLFLTVFDE